MWASIFLPIRSMSTASSSIPSAIYSALLVIIVPLTLLGVLASGPLLTLIRVPQEAYEQARTYCMVVLGGIITGVKSKFTKTGKPCGFVTLEDFEGSGELALFGEDWGKWRGIMVEGSTIYITAKCVSRYGNAIDETMVSDLQTILENDEGKAQLFFQIHDVDSNTYLLMRAREHTVGVGHALIQYIEQHPKMSYQIN